MPSQSNFSSFAKKIAEKVQKEGTLTLDARVHFSLSACLDCDGHCCFNPEIILSPYDIYRLVKGQAFKLVGVNGLQTFIERYCDVYIGAHSEVPIVLLPKDGACPFLAPRISLEGHGFRVATNTQGRPLQLCAIHTFKPMRCRYYPLGHVEMKEGEKYECGFIYVCRPECPGCRISETVAVKDILGEDLENQPLADLAMKVSVEAIQVAKRLKNGFPREMIPEIQKVLFITLYAVVEPMASDGKTYPEIAEIQLKVLNDIPSIAKETNKALKRAINLSRAQ